MDSLTDEQRKKIGRLILGNTIRGLWTGIKYGLYFGLLAIIMSAINFYYVKSTEFSFGMGILNGIFLFHFFLNEVKENQQKFKEKIVKVLNEEKK